MWMGTEDFKFYSRGPLSGRCFDSYDMTFTGKLHAEKHYLRKRLRTACNRGYIDWNKTGSRVADTMLLRYMSCVRPWTVVATVPWSSHVFRGKSYVQRTQRNVILQVHDGKVPKDAIDKLHAALLMADTECTRNEVDRKYMGEPVGWYDQYTNVKVRYSFTVDVSAPIELIRASGAIWTKDEGDAAYEALCEGVKIKAVMQWKQKPAGTRDIRVEKFFLVKE